MQTEYEYIYFENVTPYDGRKTTVWDCRNKTSKDRLGRVQWFGPWRQYVFSVETDVLEASVILSSGCLTDIQKFISALMYERRREKVPC